jgi:hypothetical protein
MKWPFFQHLAGKSKNRDVACFYFLRQEFLVGGLFDTRVSFLGKKSQVLLSCHLGDLHIPMMNANNQLANSPAIVGHHQQQGGQCKWSNIAHITSTEA